MKTITIPQHYGVGPFGHGPYGAGAANVSARTQIRFKATADAYLEWSNYAPCEQGTWTEVDLARAA